jgi:hypothetical protein
MMGSMERLDTLFFESGARGTTILPEVVISGGEEQHNVLVSQQGHALEEQSSISTTLKDSHSFSGTLSILPEFPDMTRLMIHAGVSTSRPWSSC